MQGLPLGEEGVVVVDQEGVVELGLEPGPQGLEKSTTKPWRSRWWAANQKVKLRL